MTKVNRVCKVLDGHPELRDIPGVLNVAVATKWKDGKDTGEPSIVVYVFRKMKLSELKASEIIPSEIEGVPVDIIELSSPDFDLGDTAPSRLPHDAQKRIAGGVAR